MLRGLAQAVVTARVKECIRVSLEKRHVGVHSRAWVFGEWFRHESGVNALLDGNLFDNGSEGHDVIGHGQSVGIAKIDLVLTRTTLVVTEFN